MNDLYDPFKYKQINLMFFLPLKSEGKSMAESQQTITKKKNKQASFLNREFAHIK